MMMKKRFAAAALLLLALLFTACGGGDAQQDSAFAQAQALIDSDVETLYETIGQPEDSMYASSCLGEGEDGELYYDGFTVYTYRDTDGSETVYDVMEAVD